MSCAPAYIARPTGVDVPIQRTQESFLMDLWPGKKTAFYGRVFRNERNGGIVPEVFVDGNEYREVMLDDKLDAIVFFDADTAASVDMDNITCEVSIVFAVNLKKLYPSLAHRATEEAERDAMKIVLDSPFIPVQIIKGSEAYADYTLTDAARQNMHPYYLFRIDCDVNYTYTNC